ncbi:hypothetical protein BO70DRAFT_395662 [Aspergillus heteromorphus CBS 117.55]|uniref:BTB domain-containing protein n=1 Tax=Aspergillus heteromorphus CBS 117.55 TaxID=1448321 RepID=A0A317WET5_9EURO|nr:uncharacterized protein BO70DRAFT_395662 [Aspergillus heteromorphus CBS 117.55]PWY84986.1 hypothetical protein BO70DRAFT_395662 [Aspergillus heteromorphus CBS 117.55]
MDPRKLHFGFNPNKLRRPMALNNLSPETQRHYSPYLAHDDMLSVADSDNYQDEEEREEGEPSPVVGLPVAGRDLLDRRRHSGHNYVLAPRGRVIIKVEGFNPNITVRASVRTLRRTSVLFHEILPDDPRLVEQGGSVEYQAEGFNPVAVLMVLRAAHGLSTALPARCPKIPLELLFNIAHVVDHFGFFEGVRNAAPTWMTAVRPVQPSPGDQRIVDWVLCVLFAFRLTSDYMAATRQLVLERTATVAPEGAYSPAAVYRRIESDREAIMHALRGAVRDQIRDIRYQAHEEAPGMCPCRLLRDWRRLLGWMRYPKKNLLSPGLVFEMIHRRLGSYAAMSGPWSTVCDKGLLHKGFRRKVNGIVGSYSGIFPDGDNAARTRPERLAGFRFIFRFAGWPYPPAGIDTYPDHRWWVTCSIRPGPLIDFSDDDDDDDDD